MPDILFLEQKALWVWHETVAIHRRAPETRLASSLSMVELLVGLFYGEILHFQARNPLWEQRDRLIVSKGHGSISLYPILADLGYFSKDELLNVCKKGSFLGGIPDPIIPGYETVNGSLGHGLGVACGVALGLKLKKSSAKVFVIVGDGELHEGANWEAIMFASHHKLNNLCLIVDNNSISMLGFTNDIVSHGNLEDRFKSFGWECMTVDGHDVGRVYDSYKKHFDNQMQVPRVLIGNTLKGRGIEGLENHPMSHILNPSKEKLDSVLEKKN